MFAVQRAGRLFAALLVAALTIGCLSLGTEQITVEDSERLVDSARAKIDAADTYILEGDFRRAKKVLKDGRHDLDDAAQGFNTVFDKSEMEGVTAAAEKIDFSLAHLDENRPGVARANLAAAREELVRVSISLMGAKDRIAPERFTVTKGEFPLTFYDTVDDLYIGYQPVAHNIALAAREAFYAYDKTNDESDLQRGVFLTELLIEMSVEREAGFIVWENSFPWPAYNLSPGWIGGLSQAGCMKALMLAYTATDDKRYLLFGDKALSAFEHLLEEGGLRSTRSDESGSYVWYPEYARAEPAFVLNGFITATVWTGEYSEFTGNKKAAGIYEEGIKSITHFLPGYNKGDGWSYYDAVGHRSSEHYHKLHIAQLDLLYSLTGDEVFKQYGVMWGGEES